MINASPFLNPLVVALDVDSDIRALAIAKELQDIAGGFKIGPRLMNRYGSGLVGELSKIAPAFVDCKYFDIPSTMKAAVESAFEAGASVVTVHALAGKEALTEMAELENKLSQIRKFKILAVTILTSWNEQSYPPSFSHKKLLEHVVDLARFAKSCGISSVVCSPEEIESLKPEGLFLLTPGIRLAKDSSDDQKRIMDPKSALKSGANAIVVGRPIIDAVNIKETALEYSVKIY